MAIRSFRDIPICGGKRTLILCDIDETLIKWDKTPYDFYNQALLMMRRTGLTSNEVSQEAFAESFARQLYHHYRQNSPPIPTDRAGFESLMFRVSLNPGSEIMFLTARGNVNGITRKDLERIGLDPDKFEIHFTANRISKGEYIKEKIDLTIFDDVFFIDDLRENIQSVVEHCPTVKCFQFVIF
jgi:hypothetical protein